MSSADPSAVASGTLPRVRISFELPMVEEGARALLEEAAQALCPTFDVLDEALVEALRNPRIEAL